MAIGANLFNQCLLKNVEDKSEHLAWIQDRFKKGMKVKFKDEVGTFLIKESYSSFKDTEANVVKNSSDYRIHRIATDI